MKPATQSLWGQVNVERFNHERIYRQLRDSAPGSASKYPFPQSALHLVANIVTTSTMNNIHNRIRDAVRARSNP